MLGDDKLIILSTTGFRLKIFQENGRIQEACFSSFVIFLRKGLVCKITGQKRPSKTAPAFVLPKPCH